MREKGAIILFGKGGNPPTESYQLIIGWRVLYDRGCFAERGSLERY